ncbi:hypothetical protein HK405_003469 [Cladochytrium tenue]|nr:hypothetical protein HK405_003469 [Cladochytrium tenue]
MDLDWRLLVTQSSEHLDLVMSEKDQDAAARTRGIERSAAVFNITQLLFSLALEPMVPSRLDPENQLAVMSSLEVAAVSQLIEVLKTSLSMVSADLAANRSLATTSAPLDELERLALPTVMLDDRHSVIDPAHLLRALRQCLVWADGAQLPKNSALSSGGTATIKDRRARSDSLHTLLPPPGRSAGPTLGATTRFSLALSRMLVAVVGARSSAVLAPSASRVRVLALEEGQRWCGVLAVAGVERVAKASSRSSGLLHAEISGGDDRAPSRATADSSLPRRAATTTTASATAAAGSRAAARRSRQSMVVSGSGVQGLLTAALAEAREGHGPLAMEVGALSWELEALAAAGWEWLADSSVLFLDSYAAGLASRSGGAPDTEPVPPMPPLAPAPEPGASAGAPLPVPPVPPASLLPSSSPASIDPSWLRTVKLSTRRLKEEVLRPARHLELELEAELPAVVSTSAVSTSIHK